MLDLTPQDITEFQDLFRQETGQAITEEQAREYATSLIELVAFVLDIPPGAEADHFSSPFSLCPTCSPSTAATRPSPTRPTSWRTSPRFVLQYLDDSPRPRSPERP